MGYDPTQISYVYNIWLYFGISCLIPY
jgi:hypothetical protein